MYTSLSNLKRTCNKSSSLRSGIVFEFVVKTERMQALHICKIIKCLIFPLNKHVCIHTVMTKMSIAQSPFFFNSKIIMEKSSMHVFMYVPGRPAYEVSKYSTKEGSLLLQHTTNLLKRSLKVFSSLVVRSMCKHLYNSSRLLPSWTRPNNFLCQAPIIMIYYDNVLYSDWVLGWESVIFIAS